MPAASLPWRPPACCPQVTFITGLNYFAALLKVLPTPPNFNAWGTYVTGEQRRAYSKETVELNWKSLAKHSDLLCPPCISYPINEQVCISGSQMIQSYPSFLNSRLLHRCQRPPLHEFRWLSPLFSSTFPPPTFILVLRAFSLVE